MRKRKYLGLALMLSIGCICGEKSLSAAPGATIIDQVGSDGQTYYQTIWNNTAGSTPRYGNNITIITTGSGNGAGIGANAGVYANFSGDMIVGNYLTINTSGYGADGLRTNPSTAGSTSSPAGGQHWSYGKGDITIGSDMNITTKGFSADGINAVGLSTIHIGNNAQIITTGENSYTHPTYGIVFSGDAHAVRANNSAQITIGDGLVAKTQGQNTSGTNTGSFGIYIDLEGIYDDGTSGEGGAKITIGDNATVTTEAKNSHAVFGNGLEGKIILGKEAQIQTTGENAYGIYSAGKDSMITVGEKAEITTSGKNSSAVVVTAQKYNEASGKNYGAQQTNFNGVGAKAIVGDEATISTSGDFAHGVYMYGIDGLISLGANTTVTTSGNASHGLYGHGTTGSIVYGENGKIEVGDGLDLTTSGVGSHGAYTDWATSSIEFKGGATININGADSYALYANAGRITSKLDASGNVITDQDGGNFQIVGDMKTDADGNIELYMGSGSVFIGSADQGAGHIYLHMQDGSTWYVTKDKDALVCLDSGAKMYVGHPTNWGMTRAPYTPSTVTNKDVMTANGGTIHFQTDIVNQQADYLILEKGIQGSGGLISVTNQGSAATVGNEIVPLMDDQVPQATPVQFALTNVVELGGYNYVLDQRDDGAGGNEWYLKAVKGNTTDPGEPDKPVITNPADAGVNIFSGAYLLNYAEMNTLLQRMGDLRQGESRGNIWARTYGGKFDSNSNSFLRGFDMNYWGLQVGADKKFSRADQKGDWYVGGMFGYSKGNLDYGYGDGSIDSKSIGAYGTYIAKNGFYSDLVLKYNWMKNDFKVLDSAGDRVTGKDINTDGFTASLEVGRRYHFEKENKGKEVKEGWYVEPQAQLVMGHYSGDSFRASNGLRVDVDSYNSVLGRIGVNIGKEIKSGKNPVNAYAKVSYVHEFDGDVNYYLNSSKEDASFGDSWWVYGVGVTAQINKKHNLYLDIERASGGKFTQSWAINGGYRFTW